MSAATVTDPAGPPAGLPAEIAAGNDRVGLADTLSQTMTLAWIFTLFGIVGRNAAGVQGVSLLVMFPLTFLSNAFVPTETMPGPLRAFAEVNPVSLVITAIRDLANEGAVTANVGWALLGCAVVIAVFAPLSVRAFNRKM